MSAVVTRDQLFLTLYLLHLFFGNSWNSSWYTVFKYRAYHSATSINHIYYCQSDVALRKISVLFILQQVTQRHFKAFQSETSRSLLHLCELQNKRYHSTLVSENLQRDRFF